VCLGRRREVRLDPDMKLVSAAGEPDAAATPQGLGLLQLAQAKQAAVKPPRRILAADRRGYLYVVEALDQGYLTWMPEIAREMTSRWISEVPSKIV
jgi:hypothetical protein